MNHKHAKTRTHHCSPPAHAGWVEKLKTANNKVCKSEKLEGETSFETIKNGSGVVQKSNTRQPAQTRPVSSYFMSPVAKPNKISAAVRRVQNSINQPNQESFAILAKAKRRAVSHES